MDLDTSFTDLFLAREWLKHIQQVTKEQENEIRLNKQYFMPFIAIPSPVIRTIFQITKFLGLDRANTRYLALHLYDKFMSNNFWETYQEEIAQGQTENSWLQKCQKISSESKLYLMACLQLASKMDCFSNGLGVSKIQSVLRLIDEKYEYTAKSIRQSEMKVFETVGFKMPHCTSLQCIEILLAVTGLEKRPNISETATLLLDLAYLEHEQLYSYVFAIPQGCSQKSVHGRKCINALESNVLYLGASIVLCATFLLSNNIQHEVTSKVMAIKLSQIVDINCTEICNMANQLFAIAIQEPNG